MTKIEQAIKYHQEGFSYAEIAKELKTTRSAIAGILYRDRRINALRRQKEKIETYRQKLDTQQKVLQGMRAANTMALRQGEEPFYSAHAIEAKEQEIAMLEQRVQYAVNNPERWAC